MTYTYPHAAYMAAVTTALATTTPDAVPELWEDEGDVAGQLVPVLTATWHWDTGQTVIWTSDRGWQHAAPGAEPAELPVPDLAAPRQIAAAVAALLAGGPVAPPARPEQWEHAHTLTAHLTEAAR